MPSDCEQTFLQLSCLEGEVVPSRFGGVVAKFQSIAGLIRDPG